MSIVIVTNNFRVYGLKDRALDNPVGTSVPLFKSKGNITTSHLQCMIDKRDEYNKLINTACFAYYFAYTNGGILG